MYKTLLCLRYLRTRYIALASIISVMLGVATMIVVNSVMAGFGTEMRERIHGILADVILETTSMDGRENAEMQMATVRRAAGDYIEAMTPTVEIYGMISFEWHGKWFTLPITLIGIDPETKARVGPIRDHLESYNDRMDGEELIQPALRSHDIPISFDLTEQAKLHRQQVSNWSLENESSWEEPPWKSDPDAALGTAPPVEEDDNPFSRPAETPKPKQTAKAAIVEANDPFANDGQDRQAENLPAPTLIEPTEPADPNAPLPMRLYVGVNLIEFPSEDRETGRVTMIRMVEPGDDVKISTVSSGRPPEARHINATVVDVFKSGMSEYDANLVYCNLEQLQEIRGMFDPDTGQRSITSIQIKLKDYADAQEVVSRLRAAFPAGVFSVKTWEAKQGPLLAAVEIEAAILNVLLFLIIAVAGFGILAIFYMIVVEKTRDIGILKSLGATSRGVMSIFLSYGLALGIVGSGVGVVLGLLFVKYINQIEAFITLLTGRPVFDERIYYFPFIPTSVNPMTVCWVAFGAMAIAVLASILPARRAARLHPVEALRHE